MAGTFVQSAAILLREGLEAVAVIAALAAYLKKSGASARLPALYGGALFAILASIFAAWLFEIFNNGTHSDQIEAGVIACAAALMLYVSGWLMLRQDPARGKLSKDKADEALARQTGVAVHCWHSSRYFARARNRCCLFTRWLRPRAGGRRNSLRACSRAPRSCGPVWRHQFCRPEAALRPLFIATSAFLFFMAIKFIGQAIQELQEQQIVPYTELKRASGLASIGFNPTLEAVGTQLIVIALATLTLVAFDWRGRRNAAGRARGQSPDGSQA